MSLLHDIRYGFRMLAAKPGVTAAAVLSVALGVGANSAVFSLLDAILLKGLPGVDAAGGLVILGPGTSQGILEIDTPAVDLFSYPRYQRLRDENRVLTGLAAIASFDANAYVRLPDSTIPRRSRPAWSAASISRCWECGPLSAGFSGRTTTDRPVRTRWRCSPTPIGKRLRRRRSRGRVVDRAERPLVHSRWGGSACIRRRTPRRPSPPLRPASNAGGSDAARSDPRRAERLFLEPHGPLVARSEPGGGPSSARDPLAIDSARGKRATRRAQTGYAEWNEPD